MQIKQCLDRQKEIVRKTLPVGLWGLGWVIVFNATFYRCTCSVLVLVFLFVFFWGGGSIFTYNTDTDITIHLHNKTIQTLY